MARYTLTARVAGKVSHDRYDDLASAIDALERRGHTMQGVADAEAVGGSLMRRYEPEHQVAGRLELRGPKRLRAGVDIHGDGTAVPFTGSLRRREVERRDGESAYEALRRVIAE
jgi:hypothetical protein